MLINLEKKYALHFQERYLDSISSIEIELNRQGITSETALSYEWNDMEQLLNDRNLISGYVLNECGLILQLSLCSRMVHSFYR